MNRFESNIADFVWEHGTDCPDLPFASADADYPAGSLTGVGLDHASFEDGFGQRPPQVGDDPPDLPYSVDVDLLTDEQIANTCLTVEQCAFPPLRPLRLARQSAQAPPTLFRPTAFHCPAPHTQQHNSPSLCSRPMVHHQVDYRSLTSPVDGNWSTATSPRHKTHLTR